MGAAVRCLFWAVIDSAALVHYLSPTQEKTGEGGRTGLECPLLPSFELRGAKPAAASGRPPIAPERPSILEHPPQPQVRHKTGAPTRFGATAFSFEWIGAGFTAVCFWTAPVVLPLAGIRALEGPVRFRLALGSTLARLSPNRCLAGLPSPSCSTEN